MNITFLCVFAHGSLLQPLYYYTSNVKASLLSGGVNGNTVPLVFIMICLAQFIIMVKISTSALEIR